jgi:hypothetical protein
MRPSKLLTTLALVLGLALPFAGSAEDAPGVFKIPGTETTIKFNGFAETTLFYQFSGGAAQLSSACDYYICPPLIALSGANTPAQTAMTSAYSRFGVQTTTPSPAGAVGTRFEVDAAKGYQLIGQTDTHSSFIRIRHAYGTLGDWLLVGQTWTTFADLAVFPDQQDENPVFNLAALRAPMIRLSTSNGPVKFALALEDPYATSIKGAYWNVPDIIGRVDYSGSFGSLSARAVAKQYKNNLANTFGFGGAVGAAIKVGSDTLVLDAAGGPGIGSYIYGSTLGPVPEDAVQTLTDIKLWTVVGGSVGYTHVWTPAVRSNLMASAVWTKGDNDIKAAVDAAAVLAGANGVPYNSANKNVYSAGFNTYYTVAKNFWVGAEFWYNRRHTFGGQHGDEFRGEATAHFDFL